MNNDERIKIIQRKLTEHFSPESLIIEDDSHKHAGHASARGGGHFNISIVSPAFEQQSTIKRHRMIYKVLAEEMVSEIHALSIKAKTPSE